MGRGRKVDAEWWGGEGRRTPAPYRGLRRTSRYLTMQDGVKIAIDSYLPGSPREGERLPTIIHQTRYFRRTDHRWSFDWLMQRRNETFLRNWSDGNDALDRNELAAFARERTGLLAGLAVKGVAPVDEDPDGASAKFSLSAPADPPEIELMRSREHPSRISLPLG